MPGKLKNKAAQREIRSAEDLKGLQLQRNVTISREAVDAEARTCEMAFCTETPVERWYGFEILDCQAKSVRLDRLNAKAPILVGHDSDDHVGVIDHVSMDKDHTGRVMARFSKSARGEEIFQDIVDGIRSNTSVGYVIHEAVMESEKDGVRTYRITDWEPYEVSIVSMPADINCGVGRSTEFAPEPIETKKEEKRTMKKCKHCGREIETDFCGCASERKAIQEEARQLEVNRCKSIRDAAKGFEERGGRELAEELVGNPDATVETFRERMLAKIDAESKAAEQIRREGGEQAGSIVVGVRHDKRALEPWMNSGLSRVDAERAAFEAGKFAQAAIYGVEAAKRWCIDHGLDLRSMSAGDNSAGGYLVPDSLSTAIIDFRLLYGMCRRMAQYQPMGGLTMSVPVVSSGPTAYFKGENASFTAADLGLGNVELVAKKLTAMTLVSNELVEDAIIDLAYLVADRQGYAFAGKEDDCLMNGDGTSAYGGIVGLKARLEAAGMAGIYTAATNTDSPQEVIAAELSGVMAKLPSYARKGAVWCTSPAFDELIFGRLMAAGGGNTTITLAGETVQAYLGKPREVCEFCYADATADLTGKAMAFYGNFKQGVLFGERRGITIEVLRERYADQDSIGIKGTERIDIVPHGVGTTSAAGPIVALIGG